MSIPYRLANGPGNPPDANKFMANFDWLTAILVGDFLSNGGFETWGTTSFSNPVTGTEIIDAWTLRKSGISDATADINRESSIISDGTYSLNVDITGAGSDNSIVALDQTISNMTILAGESVSFGAMIRASTASKVRLKIYDGTTTTYSDFHTGGGSYEHLNLILAVAAGASSLVVSIEIDSDFTGDVYFDSAYLYVVPPLMTATARQSLAWSLAFLRNSAVDIEFTPGVGIICVSPDGTKKSRWSLDNDGAWIGTEI